jgi:hypothetical protein
LTDRRMGAVISAAITLLLFVAAPYMLMRYITPDLVQTMAESGIELSSVLRQTMIIGGLTATLTLIGGFVSQTSMTYLIVAIAQNVFTLIFAIIILGVGNIAGLGITEFTVTMQQVTNTIRMDLRAFVYIILLTTCLRVLQIYLTWKEARIDSLPPGRIPP